MLFCYIIYTCYFAEKVCSLQYDILHTCYTFTKLIMFSIGKTVLHFYTECIYLPHFVLYNNKDAIKGHDPENTIHKDKKNQFSFTQIMFLC